MTENIPQKKSSDSNLQQDGVLLKCETFADEFLDLTVFFLAHLYSLIAYSPSFYQF
jgi:hypothetical protein